MFGRKKVPRFTKKARNEARKRALVGGRTLAEFARQMDLDYQSVIHVLTGHTSGKTGKGYAAAVALGLHK